MKIENILGALKNPALVLSLTPEEYDYYYSVLDIYGKVWGYKNERNYSPKEIEFSYVTHNTTEPLIQIIRELGDFEIVEDDDFPTSCVFISLKNKE
jgi:hypothetical protein